MKKITLFFLSILFLLIGCKENSGQNYIGTWKSIQGANTIIVIEKNADSFLVTQYRLTSDCMIFGRPTPDECYKLEEDKGTASIQKDGTLTIADFVPAVITCIEKDKTIFTNKGAHLVGGTYIKAEDLTKDRFLSILIEEKKKAR